MALLRCSLLGLIALATLTQGHPTLTTTATPSITTPDIQKMNLTEDFLSHHFQPTKTILGEIEASTSTANLIDDRQSGKFSSGNQTAVTTPSRISVLSSMLAQLEPTDAYPTPQNVLQEGEEDEDYRDDDTVNKIPNYMPFGCSLPPEIVLVGIDDPYEYVETALRFGLVEADQAEVWLREINDILSNGTWPQWNTPSGIKPIPLMQLFQTKSWSPEESWQDASVVRREDVEKLGLRFGPDDVTPYAPESPCRPVVSPRSLNQVQHSKEDVHDRDDFALNKLRKKIDKLFLEHEHSAQAGDFIQYIEEALAKDQHNINNIEDIIIMLATELLSSTRLPPPPQKLTVSKKRPPKVSWQDAIITREGIIKLEKQVVVDKQRLEDVKNDIKADRLKTLDVLKKEVEYYEGRIAQHGKTIASERAKLEMQEGGVRKV